ncbi:hypothetical protein BCR34DRAFT_554176 [Clohesyomyces aquaticus]|uniref:Extracellular membrane protein CFEM domain-containing protein n=1 Tax=Clohesyomyces aquaticus TaxID=1231657 RepID=A0A1Y2A7E0_9PLEO|nr:hypothetical protein BCR34DRAFT_554176 [Clohesyomyces aquaticus]
MKTIVAFSAFALARIVAAVPDPLITPRAELQVGRRRDTDPALVGWVSTSGASAFSDLQSCDFPATLSTSGSFAQCCAPSSACNFWTTCNAGAVVGASTSVFCDSGYCNTGVIVPSLGASKGASYLACWPTSLGQGAFTLVRDIGSAAIASKTGSISGGSESGSGSVQATSGGSSRTASASATATAHETSAGSGTAAPKSTGAAVQGATRSLTGMLGFLAGMVALL